MSTNWKDLDTVDPDTGEPAMVAGWQTIGATGINEAGQIAGYATKDGEFNRPFVFTDSDGFTLLPSVPGADTSGCSINEQGDIIGQSVVGNYDEVFCYFWTPLNPTEFAVFLDGYWPFGQQYTMNDHFFTISKVDGNQSEVFAYLVDDDGTFSFEQIHVFDGGELIGTMSDNHLIPFKKLRKKCVDKW